MQKRERNQGELSETKRTKQIKEICKYIFALSHWRSKIASGCS